MSLMFWGKYVDILPCVTCLRVFHPNFRSLSFNFKIEIQLHTSCNKLKCHIYWVVEMYTCGMIICVTQGHTFVAK
jgi:hypothetical protein